MEMLGQQQVGEKARQYYGHVFFLRVRLSVNMRGETHMNAAELLKASMEL